MAEAWYVNKYKPAKAKAVRRKNERATMNIWKVFERVLKQFSVSCGWKFYWCDLLHYLPIV